MKKSNFLSLLTVGLLIIGCKTSIEPTGIDQIQNFVEINGIKATLPNGFSKSDFVEPKIDEIFGNLEFSENLKSFRLTSKDERIEKLYA
jgi:hypothetical protein